MSRRNFCGFTLRKKEIESICLCIFINTFLACWVFAVNCISQDWRSFDCISQSVFWIDSLRLLRSFNIFFSQINEFLQEVTQFQEEKSEALLKRIHPLGHLADSRHLSLIHSCFQLTSCKEVLHILWRVSSLIFQTNRSWIGGLTLCVNQLFVDCIDRSLSSQPGHFTIQTWNNFWRPLHPFCRSISLPSLNCCGKWRGVHPKFDWIVHIPSSYPHIVLCHLSRDINLKNFWPSQWSTLGNFLKSSWDLEFTCNINNTKSWSRDMQINLPGGLLHQPKLCIIFRHPGFFSQPLHSWQSLPKSFRAKLGS